MRAVNEEIARRPSLQLAGLGVPLGGIVKSRFKQPPDVLDPKLAQRRFEVFRNLRRVLVVRIVEALDLGAYTFS